MTQQTPVDSKSQKAMTGYFPQKGSMSDPEANAASERVDRRDTSSLHISLGTGAKKLKSNTNGEEATVDTKTATTFEARCLT